jgi:hypothetical protein
MNVLELYAYAKGSTMGYELNGAQPNSPRDEYGRTILPPGKSSYRFLFNMFESEELSHIRYMDAIIPLKGD